MSGFPNVVRSWQFTLVVFMVVIVATIAALVYGIATHTEPGLMQTTPGFGPGDLPILVTVHSYGGDVDEPGAIAAVTRAVATTNERLGFVALEVTTIHPHLTAPVVGVDVGVPTQHDPADGVVIDPGGAALFRDGTRECFVTTSNVPTDEYLGLVLQHELGHCLGLDHDCWAGSIMCGGSCCTLAPSPDGSYPPRIDDSDRALLRHVFGQP